jgi:hypothetical protein
MREPPQELKHLYQEMYEHTRPVCLAKCQWPGRPGRCGCHAFYCEQTMRFAREEYGLELEPTGFDPEVPLMSEQGCTAPPWARPVCTIHCCPITFKDQKDVVPKAWHERYWQIHEQIIAADDVEAHVPIS